MRKFDIYVVVGILLAIALISVAQYVVLGPMDFSIESNLL
jgi:hypothetical protein